MPIVKDMLGNDIELDANGNVILKDYKFDIQTIFDDEVKINPITDKEFLKEDIKRATNLFNETNKILSSSPYANYKPNYLNPEFKTGEPSSFLTFREIQKIYYKDPVKKAIAPWTNKEKAYYESLETKRERYQYLVIRSGLRSAVIDIPFDAIGGVDEYGRVINPAYEEIFYQVDTNKDTIKSYLHMQEWGIAAGILGNPNYFDSDNTGFSSRCLQAFMLKLQLDATRIIYGRKLYEWFAEDIIGDGTLGFMFNLLRKQQVIAISKTLKPDRFGMLPYVDESFGADWVLDYSRYDGYGDVLTSLYDEYIYKYKLIDPRDTKATKQTRMEFMEKVNFLIKRRVEASALNLPFSPTLKNPQLEYDLKILHAKILAVNPPQGYPNAPIYYIPEYLEELYYQGKFDKKLDPRIPAMYRESFPQELRDKIESYAKKHKIKN